jgi:hypothetical protein
MLGQKFVQERLVVYAKYECLIAMRSSSVVTRSCDSDRAAPGQVLVLSRRLSC